MKNVLFTGISGFLGSSFARIMTNSDYNILGLVRNKSNIKENLFCTNIIEGNVCSRSLGLSDLETKLLEEINEIWHFAGNVNLGTDHACKTNTNGIKNIIEYAKKCKDFTRLVHISTAYVCGDRKGNVYENELDVGQGFKNYYERSKMLAEQEVIDSGLPYIIFRPSVVYDVDSLNLIPWQAVKIVNEQSGLPIRIIGDEEKSLNIISITEAINLMREKILLNDLGRVYHITADINTSMGELRDIVCDRLGVKGVEYIGPRLVNPNRFEKFYDRMTRAFQPYMIEDDPVFIKE